MTRERRTDGILPFGGGAPRAGPSDGSGAGPVLAWVNDRPVEPTAPAISVLDRGFTLADGLFETMRAVGGVIFRQRSHLDRLRAGASALRIPLPEDIESLLAHALERAAAAGLDDAALRLTVTRGPGGHGIAASAGTRATVALLVQPRPRTAPAVYDRGITAAIASGRRNEHALSAGLKTLAYTDSVMALAEARARGAEDALLLDTEGHLSEGSSSNVFLVLGTTLTTPPLSCGALPGITRAAVLEIARGMAIRIAERPIPRRELRGAHELFLTSSLRGIAPVSHVDGDGGPAYAVGDGAPGEITRTITAAYTELVRRETAPREEGA